jgi:OmpA-OmpF porin, OOP family
MRDFVAPLLCATMLIGSALAAGCAHDPVPPAAPPPLPPVVLVAPPPALPPPAPPAPARTRKQRQKATEFMVEATGIKLPGPVVFEPGSDKLSPQSDEVIEVVQDYLDANPDVTRLRIEGHTDNEGTAEGNLVLSQKRAMAVARWLVGVGIRCERLIPVGFGQTAELAPNTSPENKARNRRVAFHPAAVKGKPVDGLAVDGGGTPAGDPCH